MKKIAFLLYVLVLVVLAVATVVEKQHGTDWVQQWVYGSWWFTLLWALLAVAGVAYFLRRKVRRPVTVGIHAAFVLILLGALLTHCTARQDKVHLRLGEPTVFRGLTLELTAFDVTYHTGTLSPADFRSTFTLTSPDGESREGTVSMNHIYTYRSMRFCQMSYDTDQQGSSLAVNIDPWGIPLTYAGYVMLFASLIGLLVDPKGPFRRLLRSPLMRQAAPVLAVALLTTIATPAQGAAPAQGATTAQDATPPTQAVQAPAQTAPAPVGSTTAPAKATGATTAPAKASSGRIPHFATAFLADLADRFGRLYVYYNGRVCPMQTLALDFTRKVCGSRSFGYYTAEQVLTGWIFWPDMWSAQPFIRVKSRALRDYIDQALDERDRRADRGDEASQTSGNTPPKKQHQAKRPGYYALNDFFDRGAGGGSYILGPMVRAYYEGNHDALHRQVAELDGHIQLALELRRGSLLQIFPHIFTEDHSRTHTEAAVRAGDVVWYAPTDTPHSSMARDESLFIKKVIRLMSEQSHRKKFAEVADIVDKIAAYQEKHAAGVLPSRAQVWAERTLSAYPWVSVLFVANLAIGVLLLVRLLRRLTARRSVGADAQPATAFTTADDAPAPTTLADHASATSTAPAPPASPCAPPRRLAGQVRAQVLRALPRIALVLLWLVLTWVLALRMTVTGHLPLSNGYETTLVIAWMVQLITLLACRRVRLLLLFGFLLSGFFLLVSHLNQMDPAIGVLMPVLNSPWLSVHVTLMMMGYALLSLTFVCGLAGLLLPRQADVMQVLSRLFLLPALTTVAIGVFVGAIWAGVSWGRYWSWDPKETWALITLMVYALPAHTASLPAMGRSRTYHVYMVVAFLAVLMTYFGVNYVLGGMHAYA